MIRRADALRGPAFALALLLAAACLVAAVPLLRAYDSRGARVALLLGAVAPVLLAALLSRILRLRAPLAFGISVLGLLLALLAASGFSFVALGSGLLHGPGRLLTETLPLAGSAVAAPAVVAVWLLGAVAGEMAFRAEPTSHQSAVSLAVPAVSFVLAVAITAPAPGSDWVAAPLILVALASAAIARREWATRSVTLVVPDDAGAPFPRIPYRPVGLVVVLAAVVAVGVPLLPGIGHERKSVYVPPPSESSLVVDPVAALGAMRDSPTGDRGAPLLRVVTRGPTDGYMTVAVLDDFDGSQWTFASTFDPSGGRVPEPAGYVAAAVNTSRVSVAVTLLSQLPVPMLPVFERPSRIGGISIAADATHGMVLPVQGMRLPARYNMVSAVPLLTLSDVPSVDGIGGFGAGRSARDVALPADSSDAIATAARFVASITGARPAPSVAFLQQAMAALRRTERRVVPAAGASGGVLGGTSLSAVINAVTVKRSATPEQFATFFALVARYLGVPARVATGFRVQSAAGAGGLPPGSYAVSRRQVWAWVELPVAGMGWVVADPTPVLTTAAGAPPPEQVQATPTTLPAPRANAVPRNQAAGGHAIAKPVTVRGRARRGLPGWAVAGLVVGIVALLLGIVLGVPALLRRRRSDLRYSTDPAVLAGGAWLELLDSLSRAGMDVHDAWTASQVAAEAGRHFGSAIPARVIRVGRLADRGMCSLADPPDWESAVNAWAEQRELGREIHRGLDRRQRVRMMMSVGTGRGAARW